MRHRGPHNDPPAKRRPEPYRGKPVTLGHMRVQGVQATPSARKGAVRKRSQLKMKVTGEELDQARPRYRRVHGPEEDGQEIQGRAARTLTALPVWPPGKGRAPSLGEIEPLGTSRKLAR
jgi:hypothetical protein